MIEARGISKELFAWLQNKNYLEKDIMRAGIQLYKITATKRDLYVYIQPKFEDNNE